MGIGEGKARSSIGSAALTPAIQIERASRPAKSRLSMLSHCQRRTEPSTVSRREPDAPHPPAPPPPQSQPREQRDLWRGGAKVPRSGGGETPPPPWDSPPPPPAPRIETPRHSLRFSSPPPGHSDRKARTVDPGGGPPGCFARERGGGVTLDMPLAFDRGFDV